MASGDAFRIALWRGTGSPIYIVADVQLLYNGSTFQVKTGVRNDANGSEISQTVNISDGSHYVEIYMERASSDVAADGYAAWWLDGVARDTISNLDNYDSFADIAHFIAEIASIDSGTSGTLYIDDIVARDDDTYIGQAGRPMYAYAQQ